MFVQEYLHIHVLLPLKMTLVNDSGLDVVQ